MEVWCWQQDCCIKSYLQDNHFIILWLKIFLYDMYMQQWLFNAITANKSLINLIYVSPLKFLCWAKKMLLWETTDSCDQQLTQ